MGIDTLGENNRRQARWARWPHEKKTIVVELTPDEPDRPDTECAVCGSKVSGWARLDGEDFAICGVCDQVDGPRAGWLRPNSCEPDYAFGWDLLRRMRQAKVALWLLEKEIEK